MALADAVRRGQAVPRGRGATGERRARTNRQLHGMQPAICCAECRPRSGQVGRPHNEKAGPSLVHGSAWRQQHLCW